MLVLLSTVLYFNKNKIELTFQNFQFEKNRCSPFLLPCGDHVAKLFVVQFAVWVCVKGGEGFVNLKVKIETFHFLQLYTVMTLHYYKQFVF